MPITREVQIGQFGDFSKLDSGTDPYGLGLRVDQTLPVYRVTEPPGDAPVELSPTATMILTIFQTRHQFNSETKKFTIPTVVLSLESISALAVGVFGYDTDNIPQIEQELEQLTNEGILNKETFFEQALYTSAIAQDVL